MRHEPNRGARVLLVDDDPAVLRGLRRALSLEGYEVAIAEDGETALLLFGAHSPDVVILDVMLPGIDGLTACERIRADSSVPILMLTARDTLPDRVAGLDSGADDYLVKPFATGELLARIRALLRRASPHSEGLRYADIRIDPQTREAFRDEEPLALTPHEYKLLVCFLTHPRQALSREQLCQHVWGYSYVGESNFVDVAVKELRKKLRVGGKSSLIQTVRGYGYALRAG
jgi:two-component system response regulator MprA